MGAKSPAVPCRLPLAILPAAILLSAVSIVSGQERPWSVSPCELLKHPGMYNETLVSVPGLVLYGAGEFSMHGNDCADEYGLLRLEFGGQPTDPKDQFRLPQERLEAGVVALTKDVNFETMQRIMKSIDASGGTKMMRATLKGRFFAGPAEGKASGEIIHRNARLVISEVEMISDRAEEPVDFTPLSPLNIKVPKGCATTQLSVYTRDEEDKLQRLSREPSENLEYLADPKQVAAHVIVAAQEGTDPQQIAGVVKTLSEGVALKNYSWTSADGLRTYTVTVSRPYWLLPSTYSGDRVIWAPKQILLTTCSANPAH